MCSSHFLSHSRCLLARALASEYFDRQRFASDKRELHLREVLHTLLCPLAQIQSFGCLIFLALLPTTHHHDQCICLHPASRGSSHRHGQSPSSFEVLGTSRHAVYGFRVARNLDSTTSLRAQATARFQRCQLRMELQRLHVSRGRFRETPLNVINHDQHIQSRSPTEPDKSENTLKDNSKEFSRKAPHHDIRTKRSSSRVRRRASNPLLQSLRRESPKTDRLAD